MAILWILAPVSHLFYGELRMIKYGAVSTGLGVGLCLLLGQAQADEYDLGTLMDMPIQELMALFIV
jgi:hypothetical protein